MLRIRGLTLVCTAVAAAVVAAGTSPGATPPASCGKLLPPTAGMYFGANPDFVASPRRLEGETVTAERLAEYAHLAGRAPVLASFVQHWFLGLEFPLRKVLTIWRGGAVPYIRMHSHAGSPFGEGNPPEQYPGDYSLQNIIDGEFDRELRAWAAAARDTNIPLVVEFGDEENADWGPWGGIWNGGGETTGFGDPTFPDGPERFRAAYRHLVTLFRDAGATNVTWVFHMVQWFQPNRPWESFANYYPGDDYVDWLALSVFGTNNLPDGTTASFEQVLATFHAPDYPGIYAEITSLGQKPLALQYVGVPERRPGLMAEWIRGMFETLRSGRYPRVALVSWFQSEDYGSRLDRTPEATAAFRAGAADALFDAKPRFGGNCLPSRPSQVSARRVGKTVRVRWNVVPNAAAYEVWRAGRLVATTTATRFERRSASRATYRIRAVNPVGPGPFSRPVTR